MSVAYRSATVEGRKRMNARDNPKEGERESRTWSKLESEGSVWFISSFTTGPRSRSSRFSRAVQSSRSSWNLDQKFLWNPMEFSAWSMSLISPRELWFISFWETPTWPWVYYLNFMRDYLGRYVRVFSRRFSQLVKYFWFFFILIVFDTHSYFFIIIRFSMFYFLESSLSCYYYHFFLSQLCFYNNKTIQNK